MNPSLAASLHRHTLLPNTGRPFPPPSSPARVRDVRPGDVARLRTSAQGRIWDLDASRIAIVAGVLLGSDEVEALLSKVGLGGEEAREDDLWVQLLGACNRRCALAEAVEGALHQRTERFAALVEGCPMIALGEWWSRSRAEWSGEEVAGLLWRLSCDPRTHLEKLAARVAGDLCVRAMQLARGHIAGAAW